MDEPDKPVRDARYTVAIVRICENDGAMIYYGWDEAWHNAVNNHLHTCTRLGFAKRQAEKK